MILSKKQQKFSVLVAKLILWANEKGYGVTFGEAYRSPAQAAINAANGTGIANSLHIKRLAVDLNLFIDGEYQSDSAAYTSLGDYWKTLDPECAWGGDFRKPDGNHFSLSHEGVR